MKCFLTFVSLLLVSNALCASDYYASPTGLASNNGSISAPWDLQTALSATAMVQPGDNINLKEGTYKHPNRSVGSKGYIIKLVGTSGSPITIKPEIGKRVTIDGGLYTDETFVSQYVNVVGLEVLVSENLTETRTSTSSGSGAPPDLVRPWGGIDLRTGHAINIINCVIHDNFQGIGFWGTLGGNSTLYGNIIYSNGWIAPDRKHGHGIYTQNSSPD